MRTIRFAVLVAACSSSPRPAATPPANTAPTAATPGSTTAPARDVVLAYREQVHSAAAELVIQDRLMQAGMTDVRVVPKDDAHHDHWFEIATTTDMVPSVRALVERPVAPAFAVNGRPIVLGDGFRSARMDHDTATNRPVLVLELTAAAVQTLSTQRGPVDLMIDGAPEFTGINVQITAQSSNVAITPGDSDVTAATNHVMSAAMYINANAAWPLTPAPDHARGI